MSPYEHDTNQVGSAVVIRRTGELLFVNRPQRQVGVVVIDGVRLRIRHCHRCRLVTTNHLCPACEGDTDASMGELGNDAGPRPPEQSVTLPAAGQTGLEAGRSLGVALVQLRALAGKPMEGLAAVLAAAKAAGDLTHAQKSALAALAASFTSPSTTNPLSLSPRRTTPP